MNTFKSLTYYNHTMLPALVTVLGNIQPVCVTPPVMAPVIEYNPRTDRTWALVPLSHEPLKGRYPLPLQTQRRVKSLLDSGVEFDDLYIAHEGYGRKVNLIPPPKQDYWGEPEPVDLDPILFGIKYIGGKAVWYVIDVWEW